jgi:hypothetical protein
MITGADAVLACPAHNDCAHQVALLARARYVLFTSVTAAGCQAALYDATARRVVARAEDGGPPAACAEPVVARVLAPERATGVVRREGGGDLEVDGRRGSSPVTVAAGLHQVRSGDGRVREVRVPLGGEVVLVPAEPAGTGWGRFLPGGVLLGLGLLVVCPAVALAASGLVLGAGSLERRWTAADASRVEGSAVTARFVSWQAGVLDRAALVVTAAAVLHVVTGAVVSAAGLAFLLARKGG